MPHKIKDIAVKFTKKEPDKRGFAIRIKVGITPAILKKAKGSQLLISISLKSIEKPNVKNERNIKVKLTI